MAVWIRLTINQVYHKHSRVYGYEFVNMHMHLDIPIYVSTTLHPVNPNSNGPLLQIESHMHPFHVVTNAH